MFVAWLWRVCRPGLGGVPHTRWAGRAGRPESPPRLPGVGVRRRGLPPWVGIRRGGDGEALCALGGRVGLVSWSVGAAWVVVIPLRPRRASLLSFGARSCAGPCPVGRALVVSTDSVRACAAWGGDCVIWVAMPQWDRCVWGGGGLRRRSAWRFRGMWSSGAAVVVHPVAGHSEFNRCTEVSQTVASSASQQRLAFACR